MNRHLENLSSFLWLNTPANIVTWWKRLLETMPTDSETNVSESQTTNPSFRRPQVSPPPPLEMDGDRADNWKLWKQRWENNYIIAGLNSQPEDYKCAILLHSIGIEGMRIYNGMKFSVREDRNKMADILDKFPHSPILHYACGSMLVVLCFATKKQQKQRIIP